VKDVVLAVRSDVEMAEGPSQISRTDSIPKGIPRDHVGSVRCRSDWESWNVGINVEGKRRFSGPGEVKGFKFRRLGITMVFTPSISWSS